jgi:hypothetical protein
MVGCLMVGALSCVSCGAAEDDTSGATQDDVSTAVLEYGESTCGAAAADASVGLGGSVTSPDGAYTDPQCANAFVVQVTGQQAGPDFVMVSYSGPHPDGVIWPCNGMWLQAQLWKKPLLYSTYVKVDDEALIQGAPWPGGGCRLPTHTLAFTPGPGQYKVITQAGYATMFTPVLVQVVDMP